ncbi:hypothetical protein EDB83DRAFT_2313508 [Lactarius deliciosus]|nr:hypothetical protein EDB83DRAFT_2313508 [Lactarius deliciosus]
MIWGSCSEVAVVVRGARSRTTRVRGAAPGFRAAAAPPPPGLRTRAACKRGPTRGWEPACPPHPLRTTPVSSSSSSSGVRMAGRWVIRGGVLSVTTHVIVVVGGAGCITASVIVVGRGRELRGQVVPSPSTT